MESKSGMRFEGEFIFEQRFHNLIQKEQQQFDSMVEEMEKHERQHSTIVKMIKKKNKVKLDLKDFLECSNESLPDDEHADKIYDYYIKTNIISEGLRFEIESTVINELKILKVTQEKVENKEFRESQSFHCYMLRLIKNDLMQDNPIFIYTNELNNIEKSQVGKIGDQISQNPQEFANILYQYRNEVSLFIITDEDEENKNHKVCRLKMLNSDVFQLVEIGSNISWNSELFSN